MEIIVLSGAIAIQHLQFVSKPLIECLLQLQFKDIVPIINRLRHRYGPLLDFIGVLHRCIYDFD